MIILANQEELLYTTPFHMLCLFVCTLLLKFRFKVKVLHAIMKTIRIVVVGSRGVLLQQLVRLTQQCESSLASYGTVPTTVVVLVPCTVTSIIGGARSPLKKDSHSTPSHAAAAEEEDQWDCEHILLYYIFSLFNVLLDCKMTPARWTLIDCCCCTVE